MDNCRIVVVSTAKGGRLKEIDKSQNREYANHNHPNHPPRPRHVPRRRAIGRPRIITNQDSEHRGSQFTRISPPCGIGREWAALVQVTAMTDVRAHYPQSNGLDERAQLTFREDMPLEASDSYYHERRPHSALLYLCPREFYRGDPAATLAAHAYACRAAAAARQAYWETHRQP